MISLNLNENELDDKAEMFRKYRNKSSDIVMEYAVPAARINVIITKKKIVLGIRANADLSVTFIFLIIHILSGESLEKCIQKSEINDVVGLGRDAVQWSMIYFPMLFP